MVLPQFKIQMIEEVARSPVPKNLYDRAVIGTSLTS